MMVCPAGARKQFIFMAFRCTLVVPARYCTQPLPIVLARMHVSSALGCNLDFPMNSMCRRLQSQWGPKPVADLLANSFGSAFSSSFPSPPCCAVIHRCSSLLCASYGGAEAVIWQGIDVGYRGAFVLQLSRPCCSAPLGWQWSGVQAGGRRG